MDMTELQFIPHLECLLIAGLSPELDFQSKHNPYTSVQGGSVLPLVEPN